MADINEMKFSNVPEVHERRVKVMRLRWVQGFTIDQIVQALGSNERTIYRDLAAIKKKNEKEREKDGLKLKTDTVVAKLELAHNERQRNRWQEYHNNKANPALQRRILNDITDDEEKHLKMLQSLGVIDKVPEKIEQTTETWAQRMKRLRAERQAAIQEMTEDQEDE